MVDQAVVHSAIRGAAQPAPYPLWQVASWELRRIFTHRVSWAASLAAFLFFAGLIWVKHVWFVPVTDGGNAYLTVQGSTAVGLLFETTGGLLLFFGMMLPFVTTDAVARDYGQRVHELVMTTPLPTRAYVWGRYLAALTVSTGLAVLPLVALLLANLALHLEQQLPDLRAWVVPHLVLIGIGLACVAYAAVAFRRFQDS